MAEPFVVYPEDYYRDGFDPKNFPLTRMAQETLTWLKTYPLLEDRLYEYEELYELSKADPSFKRTKFGKNSLQSDLDNLWRKGLIDKYAEGFYQTHDHRPYGIKWRWDRT